MQVLLSPVVTDTMNNPTKAASKPSSSGGILHAASEFESMLLTQWLQAAEETFGSTPGAEDEQDGADVQMKSYAVQALAKGITAAGGIGLSHLVAQALARERDGANNGSASGAGSHAASTATYTSTGAKL